MPKQNRKPGIHLHTTEILREVKGPKQHKRISDTVISKEYYWILIAKNGKTIAEGKPYKRKGSAVRSIQIAENLFLGHTKYYDHTTGGTGVEEVEF